MAITTINENGMYNLLGAMVNQAYEDIEKTTKKLTREDLNEEQRKDAEEMKADAEDFIGRMKETFAN